MDASIGRKGAGPISKIAANVSKFPTPLTITGGQTLSQIKPQIGAQNANIKPLIARTSPVDIGERENCKQV